MNNKVEFEILRERFGKCHECQRTLTVFSNTGALTEGGRYICAFCGAFGRYDSINKKLIPLTDDEVDQNLVRLFKLIREKSIYEIIKSASPG